MRNDWLVSDLNSLDSDHHDHGASRSKDDRSHCGGGTHGETLGSAIPRIPHRRAARDRSSHLVLMANSTFIFLDPHGRRWPVFRRIALWSSAILGVAIVLF